MTITCLLAYINTISSDEKKRIIGLCIIITVSYTHLVEVVSDTKGHEMLVYYSLGNFVSNQDQKPRMIGGMAKMTLVKDETGCYVKNYNLTPVITQKLFGQKAITTYKLSDYTESLASGNAIRNDSGCSDFSLSYCQTLVKQILGDDYDESTSELNVSLHPDGLAVSYTHLYPEM